MCVYRPGTPGVASESLSEPSRRPTMFLRARTPRPRGEGCGPRKWRVPSMVRHILLQLFWCFCFPGLAATMSWNFQPALPHRVQNPIGHLTASCTVDPGGTDGCLRVCITDPSDQVVFQVDLRATPWNRLALRPWVRPTGSILPGRVPLLDQGLEARSSRSCSRARRAESARSSSSMTMATEPTTTASHWPPGGRSASPTRMVPSIARSRMKTGLPASSSFRPASIRFARRSRTVTEHASDLCRRSGHSNDREGHVRQPPRGPRCLCLPRWYLSGAQRRGLRIPGPSTGDDTTCGQVRLRSDRGICMRDGSCLVVPRRNAKVSWAPPRATIPAAPTPVASLGAAYRQPTAVCCRRSTARPRAVP